MNELQREDYNILVWVKAFCEREKINYFLYAGTLLGAIRHQGFIPWDDDVDIAMEREDFERFDTLMAKELDHNSPYRYQSRIKDKYLAIEYSKVRSDVLKIKETVSKTQKGYEGAWVDIFPMDRVPDDETLRREQFEQVNKYTRLLRIFLLVQETENDKGVKLIVKKTMQFLNEKLYKINVFIPILMKKRYKAMTKYKDVDTTYIGDLSYLYFENYDQFNATLIDRKYIENPVEVLFEDEMFKVPTDSDAVLTRAFGDYMTLPKEEDRKIHRIETLES
ncbi:LicD family protein [Erysipelothrix rhusiopathiae]|uniref:LicD family protein n=1 Tax=Erysipelothrix sp. strain 2 (EsS2-7-Brazil) TaxID=2500579 RepID=UPI001377A7B2|nr:LicD family protein [Erysipelothrix sp. strain 2 (EsS2-7-Brazil)]MBK2403285.1 LicD family protein [Erysipelothrix sp. strain 2 (EsS2-7-Brazil)]NBA00747.1 LicD family protein [Erysipelothrix rhusiopathiae]